ncbi:putative solute carrier family 25 member 38 [Erysiphe necator]|uniref:Putative solute carrier family 25 member 38 n=1 Tax=Uncinula necator TaxID=52586 RepID=A0A0B1P0E8_UNCNE|nr:putative solute carrier family 25 member 38 [Erysiphe necator]
MFFGSTVTDWFSSGSKTIKLDQSGFVVVDNGVKVESENTKTNSMASKTLEEMSRPPYLHSMIAGGLGGTTGDLLMHSLDTVKTRQQGDPHFPPKYSSMSSTFTLILRQEGIRRGLYGGWLPALLGSFPGTVIFFGTYEYSKRNMIDHKISPQLAYLVSGFIADFAASFIYVPSEVLKTRLQLQGRYNNPFFNSGYNYKSTLDAARSIIRQEGVSALFYGYKATICRDLPFSALQFYFYEQGRMWARKFKQSREIGLTLELMTGAISGGLAGVITCPLDVIKTRMQTQISSQPGNDNNSVSQSHQVKKLLDKNISPKQIFQNVPAPFSSSPEKISVNLNTSSMISGLQIIYRSEGLSGLFRGAGPRLVWTGVQSGCMLFLYQRIIQHLDLLTSRQDQDLITL